MPLHIIGNRILTDEEFKQEREGNSKWIGVVAGYFILLASVGYLFPVWYAEYPWIAFPLMLVVYFRAGFFELVGWTGIVIMLGLGMIEFIYG